MKRKADAKIATWPILWGRALRVIISQHQSAITRNALVEPARPNGSPETITID